MTNQVTIGSYSGEKNISKKNISQKNDKTKDIDTVFDKDRCVIHLIDTYPHDIESIDSDIDTDTFINEYISDQYPKLWKMMKRGDIVEDVSASGYRSQGRYIVDTEHSQKDHMKMIRCGLVVRDLYYDYDDYGTVPFNFYSITEFPLWYFDDENLVVNDTLCNNTFYSYWHSTPTPIALDHKRLKLDSLSSDNIFSRRVKEKKWFNGDSNWFEYYEYLYIVLTFKKINYLIIERFSNTKKKSKINSEKKFIEHINYQMLEIVNLEQIRKEYPNVVEIANKENVNNENILFMIM